MQLSLDFNRDNSVIMERSNGSFFVIAKELVCNESVFSS